MTFEKFCRLESSEESIAIARDILWTRTTKQDEYRISKQVLCSLRRNRNERPKFGGIAKKNMGRKGCVVNG